MKVQDQHQIKPNTQSCQTSVSDSAVFQGDCLEIMKQIPEGSIDMILCDLPYGTTACSWDIVIPFDKLWEQYERIIKPNGAIVLFGSEPFSSHLRLSSNKFKYDWIWEKNRGTGMASAKKRPMKSHETISVFYNKTSKYFPIMEKTKSEHMINCAKKGLKRNTTTNSEHHENMGGVYGGDFSGIIYPKTVLHFDTVNNRSKDRKHSTQKPVDLCEYLIKTYTNEGETVLDNCAGSGTTGIACINTNRNYILIEKEQKYFDIINERIYNHTQKKRYYENAS